MATYKDYYQILDVPRDADDKQIRSAFRRLAAKHHPDRNPGDPQAEERFKEVNEAYTVLADPEKRSVYDQFGTSGGPPPYAPGGSGGRTVFTTVEGADAEGFSDFFRSLFGGFTEGGFSRGGFSRGGGFFDPEEVAHAGGGSTRATFRVGGSQFGDAGTATRVRERRATAGAEATLEVDLEEAFRGGSKTIRVGAKSLDVTIPAAVRDGARLRLRGQAPDGGDLILKIAHRRHPRFRLEGDTVHVRIDVPDHVAVLGGTVLVPTLEGDVEMRLPPRTRAGRRLRLRGRGWPTADGGRGDVQAEVRVTVPERPSDEQEALYRRLRDLAGGEDATDGN
jgi:curved DNA-binding protein